MIETRFVLRLLLIQLAILVGATGVARYAWIAAARGRAEVYKEANRKDLLLGDFRQAATNLRPAIAHDFSRVRVWSPTMGHVVDLGEPSASWLSTSFDFDVSLDDGPSPNALTLTFDYDYTPVIVNCLLVGLLVLALNAFALFALRRKIELALERRAESERLRQLGEVARGVAHDLRSPLSMLRIGSQKIGRSDPEMGQALGRAIERIDGIANDLLHRFAVHAQTPRDEMKLERGAELIAGVLREVESRHPATKFTIAATTGLPNGTIRVSSVRLGRLLSNLLNNAAEAGAKTVAVRLTAADAGEMQLTIEDDGPGFPPDLLAGIRRGRFKSWNKSGGNGLGLRSAFATIKEAGGRCTVESSAGGGALIRMVVPMHGAVPAEH